MLRPLAFVLALAAVPIATARAETLTAGEAKTAAFADWYANISYVDMEETYEVVITVAPSRDDGGRPMRFVGGLADGERQEISIGGTGQDTRLTTLTVWRARDQISFDVTSRTVSSQQLSSRPAK